jgi:hypothetical protein
VRRIYKPPEIDPDILNVYFSEVGRTYADKIDIGPTQQLVNSQHSPCSAAVTPNSFFMHPTSSDEVLLTIKNLKSSSSRGVDMLDNICLKNICEFIAKPLSLLFNKCFELGHFPSHFKIAKIVPLYKSGDRGAPENYRPISLISNLSKIFEKIIKKRIIKYLEKYKFIAENQYGFQEGKSTEDAMTELVGIVTDNFQHGRKTLAVFLDLAKAYDTIPHTVLLNKLERIGSRGNVLKLFSSYLHKRTQILDTSKLTLSEYGLPQGTVLSPILFLIYINDLLKMNIGGCRAISFADDTALMFSGSNWQQVKCLAESGLAEVKTWLDRHTLTLNMKKSVFMTFSPVERTIPADIFHNGIKIHSDCAYRYGHREVEDSHERGRNCVCRELKRVRETKYLGVILDSQLKWKAHINNTCKKMKHVIHKFYKLNGLGDLEVLRLVYFAYAQAVLQYGIRIWGGALDTHFNKISLIQRHIIKAALNRPRRYPSHLLFIEFPVLTVRQLYVKNIILYISKNRNIFTPQERTYNFREQSSFQINRTDLTVCRRQFQYISNRLINLIPENLITNKRTKSSNKNMAEWIKSINFSQFIHT